MSRTAARLLGLLLLVCPAASFAGQAFVDLNVLKTGPAEAPAGANVTYTVTLVNGGTVDASAVTLDDPIPAGMTFVSEVQNTGPTFDCSTPAVGAPGSVTCTIAALPAGVPVEFELTFQIDPAATPGTTFVNTATASTQSFDGNEENDSGSASTTVPTPSPDVSVSKSSPAGAPAGTDVTFTIEVLSAGTDDAQDVTLSDTLPGTMTFVSLQRVDGDGPDFPCTTPAVGTGGTVTCTATTLAVGEAATFELTVHIPADTPAGTSFENRATVTTEGDVTPENDEAVAIVTVSSADLAASKSGPAAAIAGEIIEYTIGVTNLGPDFASEVRLTDTLPADTTFVSIEQLTGTPASCAGAGSLAECSWPQLFADAGGTFRLRVQIAPSAIGTLVNRVDASSASGDPNAGNSFAKWSTPLSSEADLSASKLAPASATAGDQVTFTIGIANAGPSNAANAQLVDVLPAGTTFVSLTPLTGSGFSCATPAAGTGGTVTCTSASLPAGMEATFALVVAIDASFSGPLPNTATASSGPTDPAPGNEAAAATVEVAAAPPPPPAIPTLSPAMLLVLALSLAGAALSLRR